jgi:hypothetical protein
MELGLLYADDGDGESEIREVQPVAVNIHTPTIPFKITVTVTITSEFRMLILPHVIYYMNSEVMVTVTVIIGRLS